MKPKRLSELNCSLAQSLEAIGERWTLMILRDAFVGKRRFSQFEKSLGVSKNILSDRLSRLVDAGILLRRTAEETAHPEYVLTDRGRDLQPVLIALMQWGERNRPNPKGARTVFVERETGEPIQEIRATSRDGRTLTSDEVIPVDGPGATPKASPGVA